MNDDSEGQREALGTIIGIERSGLVVVQLADGSRVRTDARRLHRPLGFFIVPVGRKVRLRFFPNKPGRMPRIVEVLPEQAAQ